MPLYEVPPVCTALTIFSKFWRTVSCRQSHALVVVLPMPPLVVARGCATGHNDHAPSERRATRMHAMCGLPSACELRAWRDLHPKEPNSVLRCRIDACVDKHVHLI